MEDGSELFLYYSTKDERNTVISYLRQRKRFLSKEFDDLEVEKILIEKTDLKDGKFGVKVSKGIQRPIDAFIKNSDGSIENIDLEGKIIIYSKFKNKN
jgi:hypothetical protein